jgi:isopentenyl-diphosphate delta-isomerase
MYESVILVDKNDTMLGTMEKIAAHRSGMLHRAISVFVFDHDRNVLLQKRAMHKYHSGGMWSNTCCSHPRPGEGLEAAANRRLKEEMGLNCQLIRVFTFTYFANLGNGLFEHELDHVFLGVTSEVPKPNPDEVSDFAYRTSDEILVDLKQNPDQYTEWFKICFEQVLKYSSQLPKNENYH